MAYTTISARDTILQIDFDSDGNFLTVACLTSNDLDTKVPAIDGDSKCGNLQLPGDSIMQTISCSGKAIDQTGTISKESYDRIYTLASTKAIVPAKFGPASPASGDIVYSGNIFVTSLKINAKDKDLVTFDAEFTVKNAPLTQTKTY